jgi:hypothetical protein
MTGVGKTISGFISFPVFLATIVPGISAGGPIPLEGAIYIAIHVVAWAGSALLATGLWRSRKSTRDRTISLLCRVLPP